MATARKTNGKDNAPDVLDQASPKDAPLKVGDHYVDFDGLGGRPPTSVYYMTIVNGPNKRGEYLPHQQGEPVPDDSDFDLWCNFAGMPRPRLTPVQWAQCEAAGFPKDVSAFLAALGAAPSSPASPGEPAAALTRRTASVAFTSVQVPDRVLDACADLGKTVYLIKTDEGVDWGPDDLNGKTQVFSNSCQSCRGDHEIHNAPALFCPWCGAAVDPAKALKE